MIPIFTERKFELHIGLKYKDFRDYYGNCCYQLDNPDNTTIEKNNTKYDKWLVFKRDVRKVFREHGFTSKQIDEYLGRFIYKVPKIKPWYDISIYEEKFFKQVYWTHERYNLPERIHLLDFQEIIYDITDCEDINREVVSIY